LVRDPLEWSRQINKALYRFGVQAEVMFASHSWPRWGNVRIQEVMRAQRDAYAHLNNWVLHLANQGVTINEIHNVYRVPDHLEKQWAARSYHGSVEHNSRAVINRYLGYWDGNPATLIPLSPRDSAPLFVEMMGGAEPILARGKDLLDAGEYRLPWRSSTSLSTPTPTTPMPGTDLPTRSSRSATSRKALASETASWPRRSNCGLGSRAVPRRRAAGRTSSVHCPRVSFWISSGSGSTRQRRPRPRLRST
jgi:hypothetical protein